jgi:Na+-driven multidrug efflux pump
VFINSLILSSIIFFLPYQIAPLFQLDAAHAPLLRYAALILFFDAVVLIPFAFLRLHRRAKQFGLLKVISITINISLNIILIFVLKWGTEAVFISNAIASGVTFLIFIPLILKNVSFNLIKSFTKRC